MLDGCGVGSPQKMQLAGPKKMVVGIYSTVLGVQNGNPGEHDELIDEA